MIFVDSSFWVASALPRDAHHAQAAALMASLSDQPLITSNHVRGETWTFLRRRSGHRAAAAFLEALERSRRMSVVHVSTDLETAALTWLRHHDEREYSFVDATSFALMRSMKIRKALAFDGDFTAAGFAELRP